MLQDVYVKLNPGLPR